MRASAPASLLHTPLFWFRPYDDGWFEVREGQRRNPESLFGAGLGAPSHERRIFWPVSCPRGFGEPVHILSHGYRAGTPSGGHSRAAHLRPVIKFAWSVCRLSFVFACPRAPPSGFHSVSRTGAPDTARRTRGDPTTPGQHNRIACSPLRG